MQLITILAYQITLTYTRIHGAYKCSISVGVAVVWVMIIIVIDLY